MNKNKNNEKESGAACFAEFIRKNHLEEYTRILMKVSFEMNIPILIFFKHLSEEEFYKLSMTGAQDFLTSLADGTMIERANESLKNWEEDKLPGIRKYEINPSDLVLVYAAQKKTLNHFLNKYTSDPEEIVKIVNEIESYYTVIQDAAIHQLFRIQTETENELILAQHQAQMGSFLLDIETNEVTVSEGFNDIYELPPGTKKLKLEDITKFLEPAEFEFMDSQVKLAKEKRKPYYFNYTVKFPDGRKKILLARGAIEYVNGTEKYQRGTIQDVTELLEQQKLNEQKDEFIGIASHELRTPLTSVKAYFQLISRSLTNCENPKIQSYLEKTSVQIEKLQVLINDFLDLSKITSGNLNMLFSVFDLGQLVHDTVENLRHNVKTHLIELHGECPKKVNGDKHRIEQVINNFVSNAVKYSPRESRIVITMTCEEDHAQVSVQDFGIGVPPDAQANLFDRFYRVKDTSLRYPGMGIGLFICKEIIVQHRGTIWVQSKPGSGSTFFFRIPLEK